jgi:hypothetical protein
MTRLSRRPNARIVCSVLLCRRSADLGTSPVGTGTHAGGVAERDAALSERESSSPLPSSASHGVEVSSQG